MSAARSKVAVIAIGRNEGERLRRSLASLRGQGCPVIYVDSGSTDDSLRIAEEAGAVVVRLDMSMPFSAARARNAGAATALKLSPRPEYLQFIDGDCAVAQGWLDLAANFLEANPDVVLTTGWRKEMHPEASVYNEMCDVEWHRPAGDIQVAGGDVMVRAASHETVGGYNPVLIAGEDPDYCLRLSKIGRCVRLPRDMTLHDANMTRFSQWWRRAVRAGHAYAHLESLHSGHARREILRAVVYALALPIVGLLFTIFWPAGLLVVLGVYLASFWRSAGGLMKNDGLKPSQAYRHAVFLTLSKFPNLLGMATFVLRRLFGRQMKIIEYK